MTQRLRYHPCVEQRALAETFNEALKQLLPLERLRSACEESAKAWSSLSDIGLFSISLDEAAGGSALGAAEEALIVMELGRCLAAPSILASIGASHARAVGGQSQSGTRVAAAYYQADRYVMVEDAQAELVLLRKADTAVLARKPASSQAIDDTLWHASLHQIDMPAEVIAQFDATGVARLRLNDAAALAGIAASALEMGVAYAGERRQFGRPIGSFQAIKHHCANMAIAARNARDQVGFAAVAIDEGRVDAGFQVDCALLVAANAALANAAKNIQIHGGIGFSEEALPHLLLKRTQLLISLSGGIERATERIAAARRD